MTSDTKPPLRESTLVLQLRAEIAGLTAELVVLRKFAAEVTEQRRQPASVAN